MGPTLCLVYVNNINGANITGCVCEMGPILCFVYVNSPNEADLLSCVCVLPNGN